MTSTLEAAITGAFIGITEAFHRAGSDFRACNCRGPQNGEPVCPCQMRNVKVADGRYVLTRDLGPVRRNEDDTDEVGIL